MTHMHAQPREARRLSVWDVLVACLVVMAHSLSLATIEREAKGLSSLVDLGRCFIAFDPFVVIGLFVVVAGLSAYIRTHSAPTARWLWYLIASFFFAFFMVEGRYFEGTGGFDFLTNQKFYLCLCLFALLGYTVLFQLFFVALDILVTRVVESEQAEAPTEGRRGILGRLCDLLERHPFVTSLTMLLVASLPTIVLTLPAYLTADSYRQISQAYNLSSYVSYIELVDPNVRLVNHHPITHTMFISLCLHAGRALFHSWNAGLYLYSFVQIALALTAYAYAMSVLARHARARGIMLLVYCLFLAIQPHVQSYLTLVSKDVIYVSFLLFFICQTYQLIQGVEGPLVRVGWGLAALGMFLFRNDGFYLLAPTLLLLCLVRTCRKEAFVGLVALLAFFVLWNQVILPTAKVTPGGRREMLSLPLQQTARYLIEYPDDVTGEERAAIDAVIPSEVIAERYDPNISDPVKSLFNEEATDEQMDAYFSAWMSMMKRHPDVYIHATLANKYQFFYPSTRLGFLYTTASEEDSAESANEFLAELECDFSLPEELHHARIVFGNVRDMVFSLPLVRGLRSSFAYMVVLAFLLFYTLAHRHFAEAVLFMPFLMQLAMIVAGPCNGNYFRYVYPIAVCLPFLLIMLLGRNDEPEVDSPQ